MWAQQLGISKSAMYKVIRGYLQQKIERIYFFQDGPTKDVCLIGIKKDYIFLSLNKITREKTFTIYKMSGFPGYSKTIKQVVFLLSLY